MAIIVKSASYLERKQIAVLFSGYEHTFLKILT